MATAIFNDRNANRTGWGRQRAAGKKPKTSLGGNSGAVVRGGHRLRLLAFIVRSLAGFGWLVAGFVTHGNACRQSDASREPNTRGPWRER